MAVDYGAPSPAVGDDWIREVRRRLLRWGRANRRDFPWRRQLPLWQGLVTEVFLQRTRASQVVPVFNKFRRKYRSASQFAEANEAEIAELIAPLGLRWRAPLLHRLAEELGARQGRIQREQQVLERLPGVGPYAAAAVLGFHTDQRAVIIDANVVRVLCRLVGRPYDAETRRKAWLKSFADELTPPRAFRGYGYSVLDLASKVCVEPIPQCHQCPLRTLCRTEASYPRRVESRVTA